MKLSLILLFALTAYAAMRRRSAAARHWTLAAGLICASMVPTLEAMMPAWRLPFGRPAAFDTYAPVSSGASTASESAAPAQGPAQTPRRVYTDRTWHVDSTVALAWIARAGSTAGIAILLIGLLRLTWLARHARRVTSEKWLKLAREASRSYDLRRPVVLLQSDHPGLLATWGIVQPKILLPVVADAWSEERARIVLTHELAHIRRGDWLLQLFAELLRAVYWFNPLVWIACNQLRLESERACDDEVLNRGLAGTDYAAHLIDVARSLERRPRTWLPAPAMARPSHLERRVRAMLNDQITRTPIRTMSRRATFAALLLISAAVAAAQGSFVSLTGSITDEQARGVPGMTVLLSNEQRQAKYEVKTDAGGRYEFVGLPGGSYGLEVRGMGFKVVKDTIDIGSQNLQRNLTLTVGELQETIFVTFDDAQTATAPRINEVTPKKVECVASAEGGRIVPPRKIRDVAPVYPDSLRGTGTEGTVVMQAVLGADGYVGDIKIVGDGHPELVQAAVAAVRDWRFTQTLLNCQPVEPTMTITTSFKRAVPR